MFFYARTTYRAKPFRLKENLISLFVYSKMSDSINMSIEDKILRLLLEPKYRYKGVPVSALGLPALFPYKRHSIDNVVSKLSKKNVIERTGSDRIMLSRSGIGYVESNTARFKLFEKTRVKTNTLLVLFDIPENKKGEREWFRRQLRELGYEMIQRSVWLGPGPLPAEFIEYIKTIGLRDCIKAFVVTKNLEIIL